MAERCWRWVKSRAGATKVRNARVDKAPGVGFRGESNSVDVVQRAALKARNLQKSHTKKPTKPTEWTIRRPSVGQEIGNNNAVYSTQSPWLRCDRSKLSTCFASTSPRSNDSIPLHRFLIFLTISGNLLLARSKPRDLNNTGFLYSSGSAS